jgi:hypothetical protein
MRLFMGKKHNHKAPGSADSFDFIEVVVLRT